MNLIGKKNIIFGFAYLFTTLNLGFYMAWAQYASAERGTWLNSPAHQLIKQAHVHGNLESVLNILSGLLICMFGSGSPKLSKFASIFLLLGALLHSGLFFLGGLGLSVLVRGAFIGPIFLIAAVALMVPLCWLGIGREREPTQPA